MRKLVAVAATASMLAGGLGAAAAPAVAAVTAHTSASAPTAGSITWGTCSESDLQTAGAQCGLLSVPLDYSNPTGPTIQISVSIIRHTSTSAHYQGIILTNPGGPGGAGLDLNVFLLGELQAEQSQQSKSGASFDKQAIADYDWVGFDPRGVGTSGPAITCQPNYFSGDRRSYNPRNKSILNYWLKRSKSYAQACATHSATQQALLDNMTTQDSVRDMNSIRLALGQNKLSYYGFSYGTYLGQVYSTMFPAHVRRLIMDSNVDPRNVWYKANLNQDVAFQRNIEVWFSWLAKYHRFYHLGSARAAVQRRFNAVQASLAQHPIKGKVGPDEFVDIFLEASYYEQTWLELGQALAAWANTHSAKAGNNLVTLYEEIDGPGDDNGFAVYNAVQCTDVQWPLSWAKWSQDNHRVNKIAPFETWGNAWFNAPCLYWPAPAGKPTHVNGSKIGGTLLIDETLDAATPFEGSREVRRLFPHSVLLAEPGGTTHADSLDGDLCVDNAIARYLTDGKLPKRSTNKSARWDATCKPLPVPVPTKQTASAEGSASSQSASSYAKILKKMRGLQRAA